MILPASAVALVPASSGLSAAVAGIAAAVAIAADALIAVVADGADSTVAEAQAMDTVTIKAAHAAIAGTAARHVVRN